MGFIFLELLGVSLNNLKLFFGMFISFQPRCFTPPWKQPSTHLPGPEIWFDVTFRGEVLDGSEASAEVELGDLWKKIGKVVELCFFLLDDFLDVFLGENFGNSKNKNSHEKLKKMSMFLRFDIYVCFRKISDAVTIFFKGDFVTFKIWGKFQAQDPSTISQPSLLEP